MRWTEPAEPEKDRLPEAYGSGRLSLVARDPHSIYAHWDFTPEQQERYNARSVDKHLVLLIWEGGAARRLISELALHPESLHWFVHVPTAGGTYHAELGYYDESRQWTTLAVSETLTTPGGAHRAPDAPVFARMMIEPEPTLAPMLPSEPRAASSAEPPVGAIEPKDQPSEVPPALESEKVLPVPSPALDESLERSGLSRGEVSDLPAKRILPALEDVQPVRRWTPEEAWEILDLTGLGPEGAVLGSMEVVKLFQGFAGEGPGISSLEVPEFGIQVERPAEEAITSPGALQGPQKGPGFWLKVNAELVIYGATEPDAAVTIGGRRIRLRPDGSFSYRFSLPDGRHELPIKAVSVDGDVRGATLRFGRETFYQGEVGAHEQDPSLVPPSPANIPQ